MLASMVVATFLSGGRFRLRVVFTPKALHSKAQGQRRSRATLGKGIANTYPNGVAPLEKSINNHGEVIK